MEKFETDDKLYDLHKSKMQINKNTNNYILYLVLISQIIIFIYFLNIKKNLETEIKYLKIDNQNLKQKYLNNNKAEKSINFQCIY